jgi:hypothetical protein
MIYTDVQVWLGLVISIVFVIIVLQLLENAFGPSKVLNHGNTTKKWYWLYYVRQTGKHYIYVFGNLLSQGYSYKI